MRTILIAVTTLVTSVTLTLTPSAAQQGAKNNKTSQAPATSILRSSSSESEVKRRKNAWTVGIATGQISASYPPLAQDLTKVLDDGENLRILPVITYGSVGNVEDLLYLNNIDMAFTKSDSFEFFRDKPNIKNLHDRIHYVARLYDAEMHILVRPEIKSLKDLHGKKINLGLQGNAANVTAPIMFSRLGIKPEYIYVDHDIGIEMMKNNKIAAALRVAGKPARTFLKVPAETNFRFLGVTSSQYATKFSDLYVFGKLTSKDYPKLIPAGKSIPTIAVPDILVTYNWKPGTHRYKKVERFIRAFFTKFDKLKKAPFHRKWRDVNLAASLSGEWKRFAVAEEMLQARNKPRITSRDREIFEKFLRTRSALNKKLTSKERELLFRDFTRWRNSK
ncbi:MAG: TAXI family TRAP transporter solute-binding subunit [Methyloligellaceae bacterium]